jgi:hypothetical protein
MMPAAFPLDWTHKMVKENDFVAIFHSIHRVLKAEKVLKLAGVDFLLIPVPRQLTSDCGLALRFSPDAKEALLGVLATADLRPAEMYQRRSSAYLEVPGHL